MLSSRRWTISILQRLLRPSTASSQCRLFTLSLLSLLLDPAAVDDVRSDLFKRHSDYQIQIHDRSIKIDFVWSPFESNISSFIRSIEGSASSSPDVIVAGSGLWHMLHVTDPADYGGKLSEIKKEASKAGVLEHAFWLGLPELVETMLNTEEKRLNMNRTMQESYRAELGKSGMLKRDGGQFLLIDVGFLSRECGAMCTEDGMHYDQRVYDSAVQIMLNALLIESQQRV
ncbi:LOW QUALITY PROTEIN: uncharacterized protein LOC109821818 [Asparagus officinalis]|uniref:LOW QUALITY PROTEIN: uncharacterized protein LOC109821818 n=1 Tax=Asparagus officinalis TaxID=4686 RepID=UPI00098E5581|nr:LOW QUALITY PROTEIN: uncharacterized protein LOC109821818 [Asparagus officinalis]